MDQPKTVSLDDYKLSCELLGHSMDVRAVSPGADTPEGQTIISGSRDKTVKLWKKNGNEYNQSITLKDHKNFVSSICYLEREQWICTGSNDATILIYKENGYVPILVLKGHDSTVCAISQGLEPMSIISGSWDMTARVWTIDQMGTAKNVTLKGHEAAVWAVTTLAKSKKFVTASADKTIFYWSDKGEKLLVLSGHTDCVRSLIGLSNGNLVSGSNDATIRYWSEDGKLIQELSGHANYIYSVAQNKALGEHFVISGGEDSSLRMWNLTTGNEVGKPIIHPAQSVWSVTCLKNGDIVTGCSDGLVRVFTKDPSRYGNEKCRHAFELAVTARVQQMNEDLGGIKKTDLPGPEALINPGTDGQTKMIRHADGSVKCYSFEQGKWNLIGDVTGATGGSQATSGKKLHEGKEYDYVFSVDISDTEPPIKLPYNSSEDPWEAAQKFIHKHMLPQVYLEEVANFIVKNSAARNPAPQPSPSSYQDPFTGGNRYVPGTTNEIRATGNVDPFTGGSSYTTNSSQKVDVKFTKGTDKHFPMNQYVTFDTCDPNKVLQKLKEFNSKLADENKKVSDNLLEAVIKLSDNEPEIDKVAVEALLHLLRWPSEILFPVLDITRLTIRHESLFSILNSHQNFLDVILPNLNSSAANQLMVMRCLANMMQHGDGRREVETRLKMVIDVVKNIKSGSANLQIAISTFYLNGTISQTVGTANAENCQLIVQGIIELFNWISDLEACYRSFQAIGNLTTSPFGQEISALIISVDNVLDKIRELTNTPQTGAFTKINSAGKALLAAF